mmetsp:Transcript_29657/g.64166  ORF Transcript_29657/g.64166 Transcript_29657/m.64166 type:complete len:270 (+) Transcript_29657:879-1688(+)
MRSRSQGTACTTALAWRCPRVPPSRWILHFLQTCGGPRATRCRRWRHICRCPTHATKKARALGMQSSCHRNCAELECRQCPAHPWRALAWAPAVPTAAARPICPRRISKRARQHHAEQISWKDATLLPRDGECRRGGRPLWLERPGQYSRSCGGQNSTAGSSYAAEHETGGSIVRIPAARKSLPCQGQTNPRQMLRQLWSFQPRTEKRRDLASCHALPLTSFGSWQQEALASVAAAVAAAVVAAAAGAAVAAALQEFVAWRRGAHTAQA